MTQPSDDLEPCPFCGGKAYLANPEPNALWRVICTRDCKAGEFVSNRTAAALLWNTRADATLIARVRAAEAKVETMREALDAAHFYIDASDRELADAGLSRNDALNVARIARNALSATAKDVT